MLAVATSGVWSRRVRRAECGGNGETMIVFFFDTWGQRCQTHFSDMKAALDWIFIGYEKGFFMPVQLTDTKNSKAYSAKAILEMIGEV